jgi:hypothetical protein
MAALVAAICACAAMRSILPLEIRRDVDGKLAAEMAADGAIALRISMGLAFTLLLASPFGAGRSEPLQQGPVLHYSASWAGLPAADIDLLLAADGSGYHDEIMIRTKGLPHWFTNFSGDAVSDGDYAADGTALPQRYDALYTLRHRRDKRIQLRMVGPEATRLTLRGPEDGSNKPPLAEAYRQNVLDPISALSAIRHDLAEHGRAPGRDFTIPVFDGARRFDVIGHIVPATAEAGKIVQLALTLRPIAGFKGESSEDGDPDNAARDVDLRLSDDDRLLPLYLRVHIAYLPLVVRFERQCPALGACPD